MDSFDREVILAGDARGLGYLPDAPDMRDLDATELLKNIGRMGASPERTTQRNLVENVLAQGSLGSCTSNAVFQALRMHHVSCGITDPTLADRLAGYYLARAYIHMTEVDSGAHIRDVFRGLNKFGFFPEVDYNTAKFREPPTPLEFRRAFDQRSPTKYRKIFSMGEDRVEEIKSALSYVGPNGERFTLVFGTAVGRDFVSYRGGDVVFEAPDPVDEVGGHAMASSGYEPEGLEVVNSWGEGWGEDGFALLSWDYVKDWRSRDFWIIESAPYYSEVM